MCKRIFAGSVLTCLLFMAVLSGGLRAQDRTGQAPAVQESALADGQDIQQGLRAEVDELKKEQQAGQAFMNLLSFELDTEIKWEALYKKLFHTVVVIFLGYLIIFIVVRVVNRKVKDVKAKYTVRKNVVYILTILIILMVVFLWIQKMTSLTIFLGVASAGIALALQEVILCMAGWFLIIVRHPFEVGDRIEMDGVKGDVIDIRVFQTSLLEIGNWVGSDQSTGRIVNVPNSKVFKFACFNYNRGFEFIWNEINIMVTFESDWRRAKEIMMKHALEMAEGMEEIVKRKIEGMTSKYMIYYGKLTPIVYTNIKDSGVELSLRYLTEAKKRRSTQDELCQSILNGFEKEETVNFAYTTYRIVKS